jgi:hypothetical protein
VWIATVKLVICLSRAIDCRLFSKLSVRHSLNDIDEFGLILLSLLETAFKVFYSVDKRLELWILTFLRA